MDAYAVVVCLLPPVLQLVACWVNRDVELPINKPIRSIIIPLLIYYWWKFAVVRGPASGTRRTAWVVLVFCCWNEHIISEDFKVVLFSWSVSPLNYLIQGRHRVPRLCESHTVHGTIDLRDVMILTLLKFKL